MIKTLSLDDVQTIKKLTKAREMAAQVRVFRAKTARDDAATKVKELLEQNYHASAPEEAWVTAKWREWRSNELVRRNSKLARAEAELRHTIKECGRLIAENSVADYLEDTTLKDLNRQESKNYIS